ncbi:methyl-accepting chemotaxis protein [Pseudoalteromonas byunsanensis]|uniref:Chemotaxis protein n=1 Tax=Pseudoalteromonas byunsanensis TaxID=327939 RepID=A0A1S1NC29_9GAMM|nr:methyl-accepting chemotaxis protein [Pseudoalteromonas byunsanensis]OHU97702.1 chemotaxis protein [Pseudoalteromonas byunsanensis]
MKGIRSFCAPAIKLMASLKYKTKIGLVFGILLVPLSLSLFFLTSMLSQSINISIGQQAGLNLYPALLDNTMNMQEATNLSLAKQAGYNIDTKNSVIEQVSIQSLLAIDDDLARSYINRALVESTPKLLEHVNKLSEQANTVISEGQFNPDSFIALSNLNKALPEFFVQLSSKLHVAMAANNDIKPQLQPHLEQLQSSLNNYQNSIKKDLLDPDELQLSSAQFKRIHDNVINDVSHFIATATPMLKQLLQKKITQQSLIRNSVDTAAVISLLLAIYLMFGFYFAVVDSISAFSISAGRAAQGDLSAKATAFGNDEMSIIVEQYNKVISAFIALLKEVNSTSVSLDSATKKLSQISQDTRGDVGQQQIKISTIHGALSEMTQVADSVEHSAQHATELASTAAQQVKQGSHNTTQLAEHMALLQQEFEESRVALDKLAQDSQNISKVSAAISEIAEQTNLLALNAAIEAARAGEQGRGFAVVADEVRTLAKRTQQQTEEIHSIISSLQNASNDTQTKMRSSVEKMEQGVSAAEQTNQVLLLAQQSMVNIDEQGAHIAQLVQQQSQATQQALNDASEINNLAEHTLSSAVATEDDARKLATMAQHLQSAMSQFKT